MLPFLSIPRLKSSLQDLNLTRKRLYQITQSTYSEKWRENFFITRKRSGTCLSMVDSMQISSVIVLALRDEQPMWRISDKIFKYPNLPIKQQRQTPWNICFLVLPPKHIKLYIKAKYPISYCLFGQYSYLRHTYNIFSFDRVQLL